MASDERRRFPWQIIAAVGVFGALLLALQQLVPGDHGGTWSTQTVTTRDGNKGQEVVYQPQERPGAQEVLALGVLVLIGGVAYSLWQARTASGDE